jgi:hypothetical protein
MAEPDHGDDLALLLATEQRLERALAAVRAEGDRERAAATEEAARADALAAVSLEDERSRVSGQLAQERAARLAAIEREAQDEIARWSRLRDELLEREARRLAQRLVQIVAEEP